jgi:DNA sulfur modification protein DndC
MASQPKPPTSSKRASAFTELGLNATIDALKKEIQELYLADNTPWIVGYSGGKDSTATLQLVWMALMDLPVSDIKKSVHVISTDTLVENPVVALWVTASLIRLKQSATDKHLPIEPHRLTPLTENSFWVNLIGKGYPAPRHKFRWCTARLKIKPSNDFINSIVTESGHAILLLGTRKAESARRAATMAKHEKNRWRDRLSPNASLPGSMVYSPIEDWSNDDVWLFLMQIKNPWGHPNQDLLSMYAGATDGGECPLVLDTSTPSCGDSRFGCWVCTLVEEDKSMTAMVQNDREKEWMLPLLELRNALDFRRKGKEGEDSDRHLRDFRRLSGNVQLFHDDALHGPYTQNVRQDWLFRLLKAQVRIRNIGPDEVRCLSIITLDELEEIRRIWVMEKHELEDTLPAIYESATGERYPGRRLDDNLVLGKQEMDELRALCGDDRLQYELVRELLSIERQQRAQSRRAGLFEKIEKAFCKNFYENEADAVAYARARAAARMTGKPEVGATDAAEVEAAP